MPHDAVAAILDQWASERPDLDASPMGVVGRIARAERLLARSITANLAPLDLEPWEFDVLATLRRSGEPYVLTAGQLVSSAMIASATLTHRVDRLVARELVTRGVDPANRRSVLIGLTATGLKLINTAVTVHVAGEAELLQALSPREQATLAKLLGELLESLGDTHQ